MSIPEYQQQQADQRIRDKQIAIIRAIEKFEDAQATFKLEIIRIHFTDEIPKSLRE